MFNEIRVVAEVVVLAVFEHEQTVFSHNLPLHHPVGQFAQFLERVGRVGKDQVKRFAATFNKTQCIAAEQCGCRIVQRFKAGADEGRVLAVAFNGHHLAAAAREEFKADAARSSEEVERTRFLEVNVGAEHVEEILLRKVGRWAGFKRTRHFKVSSFILSCYDAHGLYVCC